MESALFTVIPINSIQVDRANRQRKKVSQETIQTLANSIGQIGLLNPIIITRDRLLIAGECRLEACKFLGMGEIAVHFQGELDHAEQLFIELEENVRRSDLTWQEEFAAISKYYEALKSHPVRATWPTEKTAAALSLNPHKLGLILEAQKLILAGDTLVATAQTQSAALNVVKRKRDRLRADVLREVRETPSAFIESPPSPVSQEPLEPIPPAPPTSWRILHCDFLDDISEEEKFNFLHCDFPYGVSFSDSPYLKSHGTGSYSDDKTTYINLLDRLDLAAKTICDEQCHLFFWYGAQTYKLTYEALCDIGFSIQPIPVIWHKSDNRGILHDPDRGPRHVYETAFIGSLGDRKIVRATSNVKSYPTTKEYHQSEKPYEVLKHYFQMFVDGSTRLLDPTCGSGMAVKVARDLGAKYSVGLEKDLEFYKGAMDNLLKPI